MRSGGRGCGNLAGLELSRPFGRGIPKQPNREKKESNRQCAATAPGDSCPCSLLLIPAASDGPLRVSRKHLSLASIVLILFAVITFVSVRSNSLKLDDRDPDSLLKRAASLSWNNNWIRAEPLYRRAEELFAQQHRPSQALYAHVSQIPPNAESSSLTATIFGITENLARPEAADPETRLRILTGRGMLEVNYDAASARSTWTQVAELARSQHHYQLAVRAVGEQGISAFLLGDIGVAKKDVRFEELEINVQRSVVDQVVGKCKTEASQKPVPIDEYTMANLKTWFRETPFKNPDDWFFAADSNRAGEKRGLQPVWLQTVMRSRIKPVISDSEYRRKCRGIPSGARMQPS